MKIVKKTLGFLTSIGYIFLGSVFIGFMLMRDEDINSLVKIQDQELKKIAAQNSSPSYFRVVPILSEPEKSKISISIINSADKQLILSTGSAAVFTAQVVVSTSDKNWEILG